MILFGRRDMTLGIQDTTEPSWIGTTSCNDWAFTNSGSL